MVSFPGQLDLPTFVQRLRALPNDQPVELLVEPTIEVENADRVTGVVALSKFEAFALFQDNVKGGCPMMIQFYEPAFHGPILDEVDPEL